LGYMNDLSFDFQFFRNLIQSEEFTRTNVESFLNALSLNDSPTFDYMFVGYGGLEMLKRCSENLHEQSESFIHAWDDCAVTYSFINFLPFIDSIAVQGDMAKIYVTTIRRILPDFQKGHPKFKGFISSFFEFFYNPQNDVHCSFQELYQILSSPAFVFDYTVDIATVLIVHSYLEISSISEMRQMMRLYTQFLECDKMNIIYKSKIIGDIRIKSSLKKHQEIQNCLFNLIDRFHVVPIVFCLTNFARKLHQLKHKFFDGVQTFGSSNLFATKAWLLASLESENMFDTDEGLTVMRRILEIEIVMNWKRQNEGFSEGIEKRIQGLSSDGYNTRSYFSAVAAIVFLMPVLETSEPVQILDSFLSYEAMALTNLFGPKVFAF